VPRRSTLALVAYSVLSQIGRRVLGTIGIVVGVPGILVIVLSVYVHIRDGRGTETLHNYLGFYLPWSAAAALLVLLPVVVLGAFSLRWWQLWRQSRATGMSMKEVAEQLKRNWQ
jgi:hypothetical protein